MNNKLTVNIWRGKEDGALQAYSIELRENQTVLDIVTAVQRQQEPSLAYRFACRVGVCGSCAMTINGKPGWSCRTHVNDVIKDQALTIEPLRHLPIIKDLVCDMAPFFQKWQRSGARFKPTQDRAHNTERIDANHPSRIAANAAIECINCAVCYSACDVVGWNNDYAGPAAMNRVWTLVNDVRHRDRKATLNQAFDAGGCGSCHSQGNCTRHCPVGLSPSESTAALKRALLFGVPSVAGAVLGSAASDRRRKTGTT